MKERLKDGSLRLVIGTQALAAKGVVFADLGLLVVDEEQRFGAADKARLKALGRDVHVLTLSATPIPRTLQAALAGLQDVSVLASPPAERQPIRTVFGPLDEATMRDALLRERRRGGQSFVVCPRIEDLEPMADRIRRIAPELDLKVAHGRQAAERIDATMIGFAAGDGDVLLATNIIESGLDVPRANTIMIWRADRFGLAQLHQLRGRVGRGRTRGNAYLWTEADAKLAAPTRKRLETLAAHDRLGAGFAIGLEDLDQRGGGDLLGDTQAGHVRLIGAGLYRRLLERALAAVRGDAGPDDWMPQIRIGLSGTIPEAYVPDEEVRLNLYARMARLADRAAEARLLEEFADRFGPPPEPVSNLFALARLRRLCRAARVSVVEAGPLAIALTFTDRGPEDETLRIVSGEPGVGWKDRRLIAARDGQAEPAPTEIEALLTRVTPA